MNNILGKFSPVARIFHNNLAARGIFVSATSRVKESEYLWDLCSSAENDFLCNFFLFPVQVSSDSGTLTVAGVPVEHPKQSLLVRTPIDASRTVCTKDGNSIFCPECSLGLQIKHTDVLILRQYVRSDGCMLPRRITGLCKRQQKRIGTMVTMAQKAGLMPNLVPGNSKRDPTKRFEWKKYNKYFDEKTIQF